VDKNKAVGEEEEGRGFRKTRKTEQFETVSEWGDPWFY
jgi:hypothetical protein